MAVWTVYLSLGLLVALNASVETRPVEKNKDCKHEVPIHCHYKTDRRQRLELKIIICVRLKKKCHLHLGCAGACETGWTAYGCRCFKFFNDPQIRSSAEFGCLFSYKGNLASVHSHDEYIFIKNLIRRATHASTPTWIGLHRVSQYAYWFWSDGTETHYRIWSPGQPSNGKDERCVEMNSAHGNWNDVDCDEKKPFVCVKLASM